MSHPVLTRIVDHTRGAVIGTVLTISGITALYLHTHSVQFTSTASNRAPEIVQAESNAVSMAKMMPSDYQLPPQKDHFPRTAK